MPPLRGRSDVSPDRLGPTYALAGLFRVGPAPRSRRGLQLAVLIAPSALIAMCAGLAHGQTMAVGDRYSGDAYVQPPYPQAPGQPVAEMGGQMLSWPGKTAVFAPQAAAPSSSGLGEQLRPPAYADAPQTYRAASPAPAPAYPAQAAPAQTGRAPMQQAGAYGPPPVSPWYQRYGDAPASTAPTAPSAPQSIYDPPAAQSSSASGASAANPTPTATNDGETARFYSLHRPYGLTPDPDPIPPQFFTRTADLSDPPGPSPVYKAATASGGSTTASHTVQADDPTSTLGQP